MTKIEVISSDMLEMTAVEALGAIASYNGWQDVLYAMKDYIQIEAQQPHNTYWGVQFPEDILRKYDPDMYPRVIWSIMVMMYGDYGTSPRFGWINGSSAHDALRWITELCVLCDQCNGDCDE